MEVLSIRAATEAMRGEKSVSEEPHAVGFDHAGNLASAHSSQRLCGRAGQIQP
jgi:hypothetical protein